MSNPEPLPSDQKANYLTKYVRKEDMTALNGKSFFAAGDPVKVRRSNGEIESAWTVISVHHTMMLVGQGNGLTLGFQ